MGPSAVLSVCMPNFLFLSLYFTWALIRARLRGRTKVTDFAAIRRLSQQTAAFRRFTPSPEFQAGNCTILVAPYCAILRDYLSDTPLLRAMWFLVSQHGQLGAIPPPPFLSISPLESMRSGGPIPRPAAKRGIIRERQRGTRNVLFPQGVQTVLQIPALQGPKP